MELDNKEKQGDLQMSPLGDLQMDEKKRSNTKVVGYLLFLSAILNTVIDVMNGGSFNYETHMNDLYAAGIGLGFVFLRNAVGKNK